ncbi:MAG: O-antigen ligase family protein [bacterium]|nr:O-antigen ligase family protein [bacterium]
MINSIIQFLYYILFFFTPLIMWRDTSELFEFNKMIFIYVITGFVFSFWLIKVIISKSIILKKTIFDIPLILFVISQVLSAIFSIDRHTSIFGYYGRFNGGLLSTLTFIILFYGLVIFFDKKSILKLLKISLASSLIVMLWGIPGRFGFDLSCFAFLGQLNNSCWTDQFHPETRMFSTLGQPNWLGAYLAIHFFIGLFFLLKNLFNSQKSISNKKGYIVESKSNTSIWNWNMFLIELYLVFNFTCILFTRSRSALAAVVLGISSFMGFVLFKQYIAKKNLIPFSLLLTIFSILIIPIFIFKTDIQFIDKFITLQTYLPKQVQKPIVPVVPQIGPKTLVTESLDIRKIVWDGAIQLGFKYPLFGTGVETFAYSYYFVRPKAHNITSEWDYLYNKAHNEYLNFFATTGFIGLGTYLILIIFILIYLLFNFFKNSLEKNKNTLFFTQEQLLTISLCIAFGTILITNFIGFSTTSVNLFFFLIPGMYIAFNKAEEKDNLKNNNSLSTIQYFGIFVAVILVLILQLAIFRYWMADTLYAQADSLSKAGNYQEAINTLDQALSLKYEHVYEDKLSNMLANLAVLASYQKKQDVTNKLITASIFYNKHSLDVSPKNVLYWKTAAKNHYLFYQISLDSKELLQGINALNEAKKFAPTDPKIPYSAAVFYSILFDDSKDAVQKLQYKTITLQNAQDSIDLKPNFRDAYMLKGQLLKKYGDKVSAQKTFEYILNNINAQDDEVKKELATL